MLTLKQLRRDMRFNYEVSSLIDVLKGIASSQFRQMQARREKFLRFIRALKDFFPMLDFIQSSHPFLKENSSLSTAIVAITSDEGFSGGLNNQIVNTALEIYKPNDELIVLGERGKRFLEELNKSFFLFPGITEEVNYSQAESLRDYLVKQYLEQKRWAKVLVVYPAFISFASQEVRVEQLLPFVPEAKEKPFEFKSLGYMPGGGEFELLVEPSEQEIIDYLIRLWLVQKIYDIFWETKLSELASRIIHLEGSSQIILELSKKLNFVYFRTLHEINDRNIREIFASRLIK